MQATNWGGKEERRGRVSGALGWERPFVLPSEGKGTEDGGDGGQKEGACTQIPFQKQRSAQG